MKDEPSRTELLISSMPWTVRTRPSTFWVTWFSSSVGAAPGWTMTIWRPGRRCPAVVHVEPEEADRAGDHQGHEEHERGTGFRIAQAEIFLKLMSDLC